MSDKKSTPEGTPPPSGPSGAQPAAAAPAAGVPDLEAHAEAPQWLSDQADHDSRLWAHALKDQAGTAEAGAGEPALTAEPALTDPDDVTLAEPALASPDISAEAAAAASLSDATAEVRAVEAQAADAAVLTDPAANHPAAANQPKGTAAASPMTSAGTSPAVSPASGTPPRLDEPDKSDKPAKPAVPEPKPDTAQQPVTGTPDAGPPAESAPSRRPRRDAEPPVEAERTRGSRRALLVIGAVAVLAVLLVLLFTVVGNSAEEPGVLDKNVAPTELQSGACLLDFAEVNEPATVATCDTPHTAQLVATDTYPDTGEFPGTEALSDRATELCAAVRYSDALTEQTNPGLQEKKVIPTPASWEGGDRRIDCFVVSSEGRTLSESLLAQ